MIAIISGCGANTTSVKFALERITSNVVLTQDSAVIRKASHVILPGVGTAQHAMQVLENLKLVETILSLTQPLLGICIGMQLLFQYSAEGDCNCLGILPGIVQHLQNLAIERTDLVLPHMGWDQIKINQADSPLLKGIENLAYFYFVHSFAVAEEPNITIASCDYGNSFAAMVQKNNFFGVQFHPERSGINGHKMLKNFLSL